jgi:deaminated glutathione amidase
VKFIAAAVQMLAMPDKEANLQQAEAWVREATGRGANLVALPEVFAWRGDRKEERLHAETIPGPTSERMARLAQELGIYLLAGSILEAIPHSSKAYNTSVLYDPQGDPVARYRKLHLFDVDIEGGVAVLESATRERGNEIAVARTELGCVGLTICYDLRFPELYRALTERGAEIVFIPSAFTALTGAAHWEPLLRARAIENQVYVIAPDQMGKNPKSIAAHGDSMIVDPWGKVLARAADGAGLVLAEIDMDYLAKVRAELPALAHRRYFAN